MSVAPRGSKLSKFINHRVSIVINDHRYFVGQMLGFDSHSNIVLKDCEEYRKQKKRKSGEALETKRNIGLMILRGDSVLRVDVVGPPPPNGNRYSGTVASAVLQPGSTSDSLVGKGASMNKEEIQQTPALMKPTPGIGSSSIQSTKRAPPTIPPSLIPQ